MRQFLLSLLLLASFSGQAQTPTPEPLRIYRVGEQLFTADSVGGNLKSFAYSPIYARASGVLIEVGLSRPYKYYIPAKFRDGSGAAYGATVSDALSGFLLSGLPSNNVSGGSSFDGNAAGLTSGTIPTARYGSTVVQTTGTYSNPSWLSALAAAKITEDATHRFLTDAERTAWNAGNLTLATQSQATTGTDNSAYMSALRTTQAINNALSGYSTTTANNALYVALSGSYSNPSWLTALAATKITEDASHRFITDAERAAWNATAGSGPALATQAQATGGTDNSAYMSSLRTAQAITNALSAYSTTTANNALYVALSGSYSNPSWLTALAASKISQDASNRFVTDTEKNTWNAKQAALTFDSTPTTSSINPVTSGGVKAYVDAAVSGVSGGTSTSLTNNLTTTATGTALDAAQGKVLSDLLKATKRLARSAGTAILGTGRFSAPNQNAYAGTETDLTYGYNFTPNVNSTGLRFSWPNWTLWVSGAPLEAAGLNPLTIEASVSNGTATQQLTWNGSTTVTIQPGATVLNDPLPLPLYTTATANLRVHILKGSSDKVVVGTQTNQFSITDAVPSGTMTTTVVSGYAPLELLVKPTATPAKESVALVFDSQGIGVEGSEMGWIRKGLDDNGIPWARYAVGSSVIGTFDNNNTAFVLNQVAKYKVIITDIGNNNSFSWTTLAQAQAALTAWWTKLAALNGADLWVTTISPSTAANSTQITLRGQLNDWIRLQATAPTLFRADGTPLVTGVYDVGGKTETPAFSNSCVPCSGCTSDGTHLSITGVNLAATLVTSTSHVKEN
ncbi:hypothetical protein [Spirosoma areae]